jgi:hypothetical protein
VVAANRLHRRSAKAHRRSLREIAGELAGMGYTNKSGAPYSTSCVKSMWRGAEPRSVPAQSERSAVQTPVAPNSRSRSGLRSPCCASWKMRLATSSAVG